ncbi:Beta-galactosidase [Pseudolycoriella hygida]|uniref:Beta-galactosidase n=1 Tax=Pseudolycoriella hygida TaxID=35572 RepID=A0A9Q0MZL3_9DIPT|nr:Beta-galactosidase [Pseudolycoriella hygida]
MDPKYQAIVWLCLTICYDFNVNGNEIINASSNVQQSKNRTFRIDFTNNQFLMDDQPFRYVGGEFHYFRALPQTWSKKLRTMRAAGLNVVSTYVEWSLHNPSDNHYVWDGIADIVKFITLAEAEDLFVILRPGPYICAERDMGGFPYWLLHKYPRVQLRKYDSDYLKEVRKWYEQLMPKMEPFLYENGGPIIMVQVENEYGSFDCDPNYKNWIREETEKYVQGKALLFTNDGPDQVRCGKIDGVFATLDFGTSSRIDTYWDKLRKMQPNGPLVNSEYYPGWLTHWQEKMQRVDTKPIVASLRQMLNSNASVNFYMFFGGTNFGFTAGANDGGPGSYNVDVTSYDYDAPMDEAGDPTPKYYALRDVIGEYLHLPNIPVPQKEPKMSLGAVRLQPASILTSNTSRRHMGTTPVHSRSPMTFEALNQYSGLILYEANLPIFNRDPSTLKIDKIRDRAYIYNFIGILSRENKINEIPINSNAGDRLQIFVENQGRINYNIPNDFKGIIGEVRINEVPIHDWTITGFPMEKYADIENVIRYSDSEKVDIAYHSYLRHGPTIFHGEFDITDSAICDTYLDPTGWGKGIAFVNGFNLGRYWPVIGPQITLYLPKELLLFGTNKIVLIELQKAPDNGTVVLTDTPDLDGYNRVK